VDFARVLDEVSAFLREKGYAHALVGGLGMAAYGHARTTLALDMVVDSASQDELIAYLESLGYRTLHRSPGYSNHIHADPERGRVDFVYVTGDTKDRLFGEAGTFDGPGARQVLVPKPEHLAAMKIVAMKHNPQRSFREMNDIRFLLTLPGVDKEEVRGYFRKHRMMDKYDELERTL
jgi:hypothetical protein